MVRRSWAALWIVLLAVVWSVGARAGVDGHGAPSFPDDGDLADPIWGWRPEVARPGVPSFGVTLDGALAPLVREVDVGGQTVEEVLLGDYLALDLAGTAGIVKRLGVTFDLPLFLVSGTDDGPAPPALGDLTIAVPVGLVLPRDDGTGFGLGLAPTMRVPTGNADRWVGEGGFGAGASLAAGWGGGPFQVAGSIGLVTRRWRSLETDPTLGVVQGTADLSLSWRVAAPLALHVEGRAATTPVEGGYPPVEALIGARGRMARGVWWTGAVGTGLTGGATASALRAVVGFGYTPPRPVVGPQSVPGPIRLYVADPRGEPVAGAECRSPDAVLGATDGAGFLSVEPRAGHGGIAVSAPGYRGVTVDAEPGAEVHVVLPWEPVPAHAHIQDPTGEVVRTATITWHPEKGPTLEGPEVALEPGPWTVEVSADGYGAQSRTLVVLPAQRPVEVDVILAPVTGDADLALTVLGPGDEPVDSAAVRLDGGPLGATGNTGVLVARGLAPGPHRLVIEAEAWRPVDQEFTFESGSNAITVYLKRAPGSVKVIARGPDGPVRDALVRFDGPARLPPVSLGDDGERVVQVRPGTWTVLVLSPSSGLQSREVVVPEEAALTVVEVFLRPEEGGDADLLVRIVDPDGQAVADADVLLDGQTLGRTSSGGTVAIERLAVGPRLLQVRRAWFRDEPAIDLFLVAGQQERVVTMEWLPGTVRISARGPDGEVADAVARFAGPVAVDTVPLGATGRALTSLPAGTWRVLVVSEQWGLQERQVVVPEDSTRLIDVDVVLGGLPSGPADLVVVVTGPDGKAVEDAQVSVDGTLVGSTSTAGTVRLDGIAIGDRTVTVTATAYQPATVQMVLIPGEQTAFASLKYAPGAVRVVTRTGKQPVIDAVIRLSGPTRLPPLTVDARGERLVALSPGRWQVLAVSPTHGLVEERFEIRDDERDLRIVELALEPVPEGTTALVLRVQDPDGRAVEGAHVVRDGIRLGSTAAGGALLVGLSPGPLSLRVEAAGFEPAEVRGDVREGAEERLVTLRWVPRALHATVRDGAGKPVQAELSAEGPEDVAHVLADEEGRAVLSLRPGAWQVVATAPGLATESVPVAIQPGVDPEPVSFVLGRSLVDLTHERVVIHEKVHFDFDQATIRPESAEVLAQVAATVLANPDIARVDVQGHTDSIGGAAYNLDLSMRRAQAVVDALIESGVAPERLVAHGFGLSRPLTDDDSEAGRAQNRRVQFEIQEWAPAP